MNRTRILAAALFASTAAVVASHSLERDPVVVDGGGDPVLVDPGAIAAIGEQRQRIEVVFALDTTGSMGGLIEAAKEKIWSIASTMASAEGAPEIRVGLVAYRDRGDAYVTRVVDLSSDLDAVYATLMELQAAGGGDGPESVNQALHDAVHGISWSQGEDAYKVVFLVGDAPPHMDYRDDVPYPQTLRVAAERGIVVNAIQCGTQAGTTARWEQIARLGAGQYFRVDQAGGAVAVATPFDDRLAALSARFDRTRMYYGTVEEREEKREKMAVSERLRALASVAAQARRGIFNAMPSGAASHVGEKDLVTDVASGRADLAAMPASELPEPLQALAPEERARKVEEMAKEREELRREIAEVSRERQAYIEREVEAAGDADASLDHRLYDTVREQAARKGLRYEEAAPRY